MDPLRPALTRSAGLEQVPRLDAPTPPFPRGVFVATPVFMVMSLVLAVLVAAGEQAPGVQAEPSAQSSQPSAGQNAEKTASEQIAKDREAALQAAQEQVRAASARTAALEQQVAALQEDQARDTQHIAALEANLAAERVRREQAQRDRAAAGQNLATAASGLDRANAALAAGSSDVGGDVARARELAADAARLAGQGSPLQAALAAAAQESLAASQQQMANGDLYRARVEVIKAQASLQRARALGGTGANASGQ